MAKLILYHAEARAALGRGVEKLTATIQGTLGPKGGNTIMDRPVGTPIVSRDGVSIIKEIELEDQFENIGAQLAREVSMQTNEDVGDGTTTALVLANAMIQRGFEAISDNAIPIDLVDGMHEAIGVVVKSLQASASPVQNDATIEAVARISSTEPKIGRLVAEAIKAVGRDGFISVEFGQLGESKLIIDKDASFDRGYLSRNMATDLERMEAVLDNPLLLISDLRINTPEQMLGLHAMADKAQRPMLVIADQVSEEAIAASLSKMRAGGQPIVAVNPPEYGRWRKAYLEDLAILTGGRVLVREFGTGIEAATMDDMGSAESIRVNGGYTYISGGKGDPVEIKGRREHIIRQMELVEVMVEKDKLDIRLAKLSGGVAVIEAGGATPAERMRREQLVEDAINATRAAMDDGVVPGGGTALAQSAGCLDETISNMSGSMQRGAQIIQQVLSVPVTVIAENCGSRNPDEVATKVANSPKGVGYNGWTGDLTDMCAAGIVDPARTPCAALENAGSIAGLILMAQSLVVDKPEWDDPTYGPARGGGAELIDMD